MSDVEKWFHPDLPEGEERLIRFRPAFHRCHTNHGIGSVQMLWVLRDGDWAMTWDVFTDWGLPDEAFKAASPGCTHWAHQNGYPPAKPMGGAVDWHSPVPTYEGQTQAQERCPITHTACFLDSGFLLGDDLFNLLRAEGDEAVWQRMRQLLDEAKANENDENEEGQET